MSPLRLKHFVFFAALGASGCSLMRGTVDEARFRSKCVSVLHHEDAQERAELERDVLARTRLLVRVRALSSDELSERVGSVLYADDVTLLAYEAIDQGHPCCTTKTKVWLTSGTVPWRPLVGADVYRHAGLEPPVAPTLDPKFSYAGFAVDVLFALFTGGQAPSKFRGTESWSPVVSPGREGTGTPEQKLAANTLIAAQGKDVVEEAWVNQSRRTSALFAPPTDIAPGKSANELSLVVEVKLGLSEEDSDSCPFVVRRTFSIGGTGSAGARVTAFMKEHRDELVIGGRR